MHSPNCCGLECWWGWSQTHWLLTHSTRTGWEMWTTHRRTSKWFFNFDFIRKKKLLPSSTTVYSVLTLFTSGLHFPEWNSVDLQTLFLVLLTGVVPFQRSCPVRPNDSILFGLVLRICLLFWCNPIGRPSLLSLQLIGREQGGGRVVLKHLRKANTELCKNFI